MEPLAKVLLDVNSATGFAQFLTEQFQDNYLKFWLAVDEYKKLPQSEKGEFGKQIYSTYINNKSSKYLAIDDIFTDGIEQQLSQNPTDDCFEAAKRVVEKNLNVLCTDYFTRGYRNSLEKDKKPKKKGKLTDLEESVIRYCEKKNLQQPTPPTTPRKNESMVHEPISPVNDERQQEDSPAKKNSLRSTLPSRPSGQLGPAKSTEQEKESFVSVIINPSFILIRNLVEIGINNGEFEKLAEGIVDIFLFYNKLSELIKELVAYELDHYSKFTIVELFKGDSLASVVIIQFFHRVGRDYLLKLINCAINPLLELYPDGFNLGVLENHSNQQNVETFSALAEGLLREIIHSKSSCPAIMRREIISIYKTVEEKLPGKGLDAIGSLLIYQFFCNSLVIPEKYYLIEQMQITRNVRKVLILYSKFLRGLVTKATSRNKISVVENLSTKEKQVLLSKFIGSLVNDNQQFPASLKYDIPSDNASLGLKIIKQFTVDNLSILWAQVIQTPELASTFMPFLLLGLKSLYDLNSAQVEK